jgi:solute carrier family 25 folate transporter 32
MDKLLINFSSSAIASTIVYPLDVIKTQYQYDGFNKKISLSVNKVIQNIYIKNGIFGYFKGVSPHLITYPIFWTSYFYINSHDIKLTSYKYANKIFMSFIAASGASIITNPLFVIKIRVQTTILKDKKNVHTTYIKLVKSIYKFEGLNGFYKGLASTLTSNLKMGFQMPLCDFLKEKYLFSKYLQNNNYDRLNTISSYVIGKLSCSTIFYPLDLIRTTQRASECNVSMKYAFKTIYDTYGICGLYRGAILYNLVTGPNFVIMMLIKDELMKLTQ